MGEIKEYILSVITAGAVCAALTHIVGHKGTVSAVIKLLTGLFMSIVLLQPLISVQFSEFVDFTEGFSEEANIIAEEGKQLAKEQMEMIIINRSQAYILDKAAALGLEIDAEVILTDCIPSKVRLFGHAAPYAKNQLSVFIAETLDIPTEAQEWIYQ